MLLSIKNKQLQLTVDTLGAQIMSIQSTDGCEYLWQGDKTYWSDRSPLLFPFIGRLYGEKYTCMGKEYPLPIHGFAAHMEFTPQVNGNALTMVLNSSGETLKCYPFPFVLTVTFTLEGSKLLVHHRVSNTGRNTMYFGLGGHPGFRVPLAEGEAFESYSLEFSAPCFPDRVLFTEQVLLSGQTAPYKLENDKCIPLCHGLFDEDAIILQNTAPQVTLAGPKGRSVTLEFGDFPYFGIWHMPKTDAPYVCLEPWSSLPGRQDIIEDFACRSDLITLAPGKEYTATWSVTIK